MTASGRDLSDRRGDLLGAERRFVAARRQLLEAGDDLVPILRSALARPSERGTALRLRSDPWLRTIATGDPGVNGVARAPHLSEFSVPPDRLIAPSSDNALSLSEGEFLWQGNDLADFLVETRPNPY